MTLVCKNNYISKTVCVLLVVCLLVSCCLGVKAHALAITGGVVIAAAAATVVASTLVAMGISHGTANTDFDNLVTGVVGHLGSLGYVRADGTMMLNATAAGITTIGGNVLSAIRDFLFNLSAPVLVCSGSCPATVQNLALAMRQYASSNNWPSLLDSSQRKYLWCCTTEGIYYLFNMKTSGDVSWSYNDSTLQAYHTSAGQLYWFAASGGEVSQASGNLACDTSSSLHVSSRSCLGSLNNSDCTINLTSSRDLNISGVPSAAADDDKAPDVIYPGWAEHAENVDTNIEVDLDNDGTIDGVIVADKYYPISVPDTYDATHDLTQSEAQEGTEAAEDTQEQEGTQDTDWTKKIEIGESSDYTLQLRDFFPFCVPFDLYDMLDVLAADPVAPQFQWVIPVLGQSYTLDINLSGFDTVAAIVRTMELLAFAVGLALGTKKLIQGGD